MLLAGAQVISSLGGTATVITADLLIKTVTFTTNSILRLGKTVLTPSPYIDYSELEVNDLVETIRIYELYIREILEKDKKCIDNCETIKAIIQSIQSILEDLHNLLEKIEKKLSYHKTLWFQSWRTLDFTKELHDIKLKKNILNSRFDILQKIYKK